MLATLEFAEHALAVITIMPFLSAVSKKQYLHEAQFALLGCQMVEEILKSILMYVREVNRLSPVEYALIQRTDLELDELPLGALIKNFERAFPASNITASLNALRPERNHSCSPSTCALLYLIRNQPQQVAKSEAQ